MRKLELLSPARDAAIGRVAILAGADAVYIGAPAFGARASATNSVEDIAGLVAFAHLFRARVYVTMNTILYDSELEEARKLVWQLYSAGVDALIVQDMAYLKMELPPIALHASTQCDIRTPEKAAFLAKAGFSQLVLPREFTLEEISACEKAAGVPVEVFVHGALCVSYSGDCQAGFVAMGRSANRGECPQMCRLPYELVDSEGNSVGSERHYLSLKDLNQSSNLEQLIEAGACSFKIEGRLKDARYVANVTAEYSRRLNEIIAQSGGKYERASKGTSECSFTPDLRRTFNRGYTSYFAIGKPSKMASLDSPKWVGMPVAAVSSRYNPKTKSFTANVYEPLSNGDGLGYFDSKSQFCGFRLNKVVGNVLYPASDLNNLPAGAKLYRNNDKEFFDVLDRADSGCKRTIAVKISCSEIDENHFSLQAEDERGCRVESIVECMFNEAKTPQEVARKKTLEKTGGSIYRVTELDDTLGKRFVPASVLTSARRELLTLLDAAAEATYEYDRRKPAQEINEFKGQLTYHANVANRLAEAFYKEHGATVEEKAIEVELPEGEVRVMTTRYCIRRELGACLKEKNARKLPSPLYLRNNSGLYRLDFDCKRCGMNVIKCR